MRWAIAVGVLVVVLLVAGVATAQSRPRFDVVTSFPPDKWGKTPRPAGDKKRLWVEAFVPEVRPVLEAKGMPPAVGIGQAAVETGWGGAGPNNPWGIRGLGDAGSDLITTKEEFTPGKVEVQTGQKFAKFSSRAAAARGYASFLSGPRYRAGWGFRESDVGRWLLWLWGYGGYATAAKYPSSVVDASRRVAVEMNDPTLAIPWTPEHAHIATQLGAVKAGSERRALAQRLLGVVA